MNYDFHTTTWTERNELMKNGVFTWKTIKPTDFVQLEREEDRSRPIVWEEDTGKYYEITYHPVLDTIKEIDNNPNIDYKDTTYYRFWVETKGEEYINARVGRLKDVLFSMKKIGFDKDDGAYGGVCVERTGQKLDGSHRSLVAHYLGIKSMRVKEYAFNWRDVSWDWLKRQTKAREIGLGPNYYLIDYGSFKNLEKPVSSIYKENAEDRWEVIRELIDGSILDLGCNDGYLSIRSAMRGHKVHGVDYKFIEGAWLNKLIFEKMNEKDLPVSFDTADLSSYQIKGKYDTCLLLNVIYHTKNKLEILREVRKSCQRVIMQGNLRKLSAHDRFYGITVEDMEEMLQRVGFKTNVIEWRDKPIVMGV